MRGWEESRLPTQAECVLGSWASGLPAQRAAHWGSESRGPVREGDAMTMFFPFVQGHVKPSRALAQAHG